MNLSSLKQHGIALAIFIVIVLAFCYPVLQGNVLQSHDNLSWQYMSQEGKAWYEAHGGSIYWSNSMFGGMPTYTHYGGSGYGNILAIFYFKMMQLLPRPMMMFLISLIGFYILGTSLRWNFWVRIISSFAFAFSSYIPILAGAGHDTKLMAIASSAAAIGGLINILNDKKWQGISIYTIGMFCLFSSSHLQIVYYILLLLGIMASVLLIYAIKENQLSSLLKKIPFILVGTILAVLPTLSSNLLIKDYSKSTIRGGQSELTSRGTSKKSNGGLDKDYAFSWSNGIGETFSLLIPRLYGGGSSESYQGGAAYEYVQSRAGDEQAEGFANQLPLYCGPQPFLSGPIYFGAAVVFLFIFSLFVVKSKHKWWIAFASLFFILLSLGKNLSGFNFFLFDHLPMYNKFRTPSMALSIPMFLFPLLGFWALDEVLSGKISKEIAMKYLKISMGITSGIAIVVGIGASMFFSFKGEGDAELLQQLGGVQAQGLLDAIISDRASVAMKDGFRSLLLILISGGAIWAFLTNKLGKNITLVVIALICFIDLFGVGQRYLGANKYEDGDLAEQGFQPRPVDVQILQDKDPYYRVQDFTINTYNDAKPSYFHKMVGGYHPAKIEMYQDLIEKQMTPGSAHNNGEVYNMLNTKYFIVPEGNKGEAQVVPNPFACGNAWFVPSIKYVATADAEMEALNAPNIFDTLQSLGNFKAKEMAIVRDATKKEVESLIVDSTANIKLANYGLNNLSFESHNSNAGFAVFSDIYYDGGWTATIDGKESKIIRTNYVLRGLRIPAGNHKIEFKLFPKVLKTTQPISMIGCALVLFVFAFGLYKSKKTKEFEFDEIELKNSDKS